MPPPDPAPGPGPANAADPDPLTQALGSPEVGARRKAVEALGEAGRTSAGPAIAHHLRADPEPSVRAEAAAALARIQGREAIPALLSAMDDAALEVRSRAIVSLGRTGAVAAMARLHEAGEGAWDPRPLVREAARVALRTICRERTEEAAAHILGLLRAEGRSASACADLVRVLAKETESLRYVSPPPPVPAPLAALFAAACADGAAEVRAAAAGLAANLRLTEAADDLLGALERGAEGREASRIIEALALEIRRTRLPDVAPRFVDGAAEIRAARAVAAVLPHLERCPKYVPEALSGFPGRATTEALVGLLGKAGAALRGTADPALRGAPGAALLGRVVEALGVLADPGAVPALLERLAALIADRHERAPGVDCALAGAIAAAGDRRAAAPLLAHLEALVAEEPRRPPTQQGALLAALVAALERLEAPAPPDLLAQALDQELGVVACAELACALLRARDPRGLVPAVEALAFARRKQPEPLSEFDGPADGGVSNIADALLTASLPPLLASLGGVAVDALLDLSASESADVRAAALSLLQPLGDERAAPVIRRCLEDPDERVRVAAERAAGSLGGPDCAPFVLESFLASTWPGHREPDLRLLVTRHGPRIPIDVLRQLAALEDRTVKSNSRWDQRGTRQISFEELRLVAKKALCEAEAALAPSGAPTIMTGGAPTQEAP